MKELISISKAIEILSFIYVDMLGKERISIFKAKDRVLAQDIVAHIDVPGFDRSAMDGYAIKAEDTFGSSDKRPSSFKLKGDSDDESAPCRIGHGDAIKVHTGSVVPEGANAVVRFEDAVEVGGSIKVFKTIIPGKNISYKGEDIKCGNIILRSGRILRSQHIGMIASLGYGSIEVYRRPVVAVFATGDDLVEVGSLPTEGKTLNSNIPMIYGSLKELGCKVIYLGIAENKEEGILAKLNLAIEKADAVITIGGMSVGNKDIVPQVIGGTGKILFHGVRIRPGKLCGAAVVGKRPVLMLPGYPVAALLTFKKFFPVILSRMMGNSEYPGKEINFFVRPKTKISTREDSTYLVKVNVYKYLAEPVNIYSDVMLSSMVNVNAILEIPEEINEVTPEDMIECTYLG